MQIQREARAWKAGNLHAVTSSCICICFFFSPVVLLLQHVGDLGNIVAGPDGRASFRLEDGQIKVT